jgi:multisubunit Na+/H+ antiporter MnhC subunit
MEPLFALLVGALFTVAIYLFMSKHIIRVLMGAAILSNAVNLLIFTAGRSRARCRRSSARIPTCCRPGAPTRCRRRLF